MRFRVSDMGEVDSLGRRKFVLHWNEHLPDSTPRTVGRRAQHFFAVLEEHVAQLRKDGHEVVLP